MAGARAAVGRRKASAPRSACAASDDAAHTFAPFGALPPLIFLEAKGQWLWSAQLGRGLRRGNDLLHPPLQGEGRGPKGRGVGCAAMQGVAARYARFHPNPPRFARRPSPSRGRWKMKLAFADFFENFCCVLAEPWRGAVRRTEPGIHNHGTFRTVSEKILH